MILDTYISKRWQLVLLLSSGMAVEYALRVNAGVAVVEMADSLGWCVQQTVRTASHDIPTRFGRSEGQREYVLSSFYWGYAFGQLPSILLSRHVSAKYLFGFSIALASICTLAIPVAAGSSLQLCLLLRAMAGLAESAAFPAAFHLYKSWITSSEKTIMIATVMSGMYMVGRNGRQSQEIVLTTFPSVLRERSSASVPPEAWPARLSLWTALRSAPGGLCPGVSDSWRCCGHRCGY